MTFICTVSYKKLCHTPFLSYLLESKGLKATMGQSVSAVRENQANQDKAAEERLQILEKMIHGRLQNVQTEILSGTKHDQEIDTGTIVDVHKQVNVTESKKEDIASTINKSIGDFFSGNWKGGLTKIIQVGADTVLGNISIGEYETTDMFIVWSNNALLRCDAYYYRWNFAAEGVIKEAEGVVGILLVKRVIDLTKTDPQVLTWAITEQGTKQKMDEEEIESMITSAVKVIKKVVSLQTSVRQLEAGGSGAAHASD